jgi:hypothetical protein
MHYPALSIYDPVQMSEGNLDPLGLVPVSEALAVRLVPGVRERQSHPRFLTAYAVSLHICSEFDDDVVAADGVSPPGQVFEWLLVEGMVRRSNEDSDLAGLPGRLKAAQAIETSQPLSAQTYLQVPRTFGFQGVYRRLARELGLDIQGCLGEPGYELLNIWSTEQGLTGFVHGQGTGTAWRQSLVQAVRDSLTKGAVARVGGWDGWDFFTRHLQHRSPGVNECKYLISALRTAGAGYRRELFDFLVSPQGRSVRQAGAGERQVHQALLTVAGEDLRSILETIMIYESAARLLQDAFDDCLAEMTVSHGGSSINSLAALPAVQAAVKGLPKLYNELLVRLADCRISIHERFHALGEQQPARQWIERLLQHHRDVQRQKPPAGKAPWIERTDSGRCFVRSLYRREPVEAGRTEYVHMYRTKPLWTFAEDLGLVER